MKKWVGITKEPVHGRLHAKVYSDGDALVAMMPGCWGSDDWSLGGAGTCWCFNHAPSVAKKIDADCVEFFDETKSEGG